MLAFPCKLFKQHCRMLVVSHELDARKGRERRTKSISERHPSNCKFRGMHKDTFSSDKPTQKETLQRAQKQGGRTAENAPAQPAIDMSELGLG